ncbi:c-type cytochrome [Variovorax soli]|uniref:c-type cytochrome n=1 Tax=Variovorax soli TaxID=376815 RepID=UPI000A03870A
MSGLWRHRPRWLAGALVLAVAGMAGAATFAPPADSSQQQVLHGEQVYVRCQACHALAQDRVGPHHCGLLGRRAGSVPGFAYSQAMKDSRITWDEKTLDQFLSGPLKTMPGTSMTYDGVPDAKDRADLIAYLRHANESAQCRPSSSAAQR